MKGICFVLIGLLAGMISCDNDEELAIPPGTYVGEFNRYTPGSTLQSAHVTITIDQNTFSGANNDESTFPAIGQGSYKLVGPEIEFTNHAQWTTEFDGSYVLGGKFKMKVMGEELIMVRMYDNQITDLYRLQRQ